MLKSYDSEIGQIAADYGLETYPNQIEIITSEQMLDAYSTIGMPLSYHHWSFGKQFLTVEKNYQHGHMGLAYEIVINSNPCIAYLMEENTMPMQALVIAHASYGHNSFFKNNYLFKMWTDADSIIDYMVFARNFVAKCEERYGIDEVEEFLDACHSLMNYGVDRYKHPSKPSPHEENIRQHNRELYLQSQVNDLWRTLPKHTQAEDKSDAMHFPSEPQENILYFVEKHGPLLKPWQREMVRIIRKVAQYFYPQRQTQVMNEGWACFWHYTLLNDLYNAGYVTDEFMLEFLQNHTNVIYQPPFNSPFFTGINPYTLGFNMMMDIKRICEKPTAEDKQWFPDLVNTNCYKQLDFAMRNFKDESFISQYLSPHLIRELKLFSILDDDEQSEYIVTAIHNEQGYQAIREKLSKQYNLGSTEPNIQVYKADVKGDRSLTLQYHQQQRRLLTDKSERVLKYLHYLWGFPIHLETVDSEGTVIGAVQFPKHK